MRESIGSIAIFGLVSLLILIFAGIMSLTINRSNAYGVKDKLVSVIEEYGFFDTNTDINSSDKTKRKEMEKIVDLLDEYQYRQTGECPDYTDEYGYTTTEVQGYLRSGDKTDGNDASFCVVKIKTAGGNGLPDSYVYKIVVFYKLDLPIVNNIFNFTVSGETKVLYS